MSTPESRTPQGARGRDEGGTLELLAPLSSQWQLALFALVLVMGALLWRGHRQMSGLAETARQMREQLLRLARTVEEIEGRTTNTEHTLIANLSEYRMAMGSTSAYREYLQKLGVTPGGDVEPILEAVPDGAMAVGKDGRLLYVNRVLHDLLGVAAGMTVDEVMGRLDARSLEGEPLPPDQMPERMVLRGQRVRDQLVRLRPEDRNRDVILAVNGSPVRDVFGRVIAAVVIARPVSEEVALAIEVRKVSEGEGLRPPPHVPAA